jgi:glycosyltransferase involved in cell wall biosynthesis
MVSIIIPAYGSKAYIDECLESIKSNIPFEIIIGVDGDKELYNYCIPYEEYGIKVYYFTDNVGPFVIKNTLIDTAIYENILFFDSDDIMAEGIIAQFHEKIHNSDYVKLNYVNFNKDRKNIKQGHIHNDAVIGIKKNIFNKINGFYPWKCGADTELSHRLDNNGYKMGIMEGISYYRRLHDNNLTIKEDTKHGSAIRNEYVDIINSNLRLKYWPNPHSKIKGNYVC